jgi:hypothetical protein
MRLPYQLSKIGKEKRKSGSFRLCGPKCPGRDSGDVTPIQAIPAGRTIPGPRENVLPSRLLAPSVLQTCQHYRWRNRAKTGSRTPGIACLASGAIKKLPQVGQEPVEAVESEHISPDGPMIIDCYTASKDIPAKIPIILGKAGPRWKPLFSHPGLHNQPGLLPVLA